MSTSPCAYLSGLVLVLISASVLAEKADRTKPLQIAAKALSHDATNDIQVLEGSVELVQGTLRITAARGETRGNAQGVISGTLTGSPVTLRQKREGCDQYIEAFAEKVEFDQAADIIKLISKARLKSGNDELTGNVILYNSATEFYQVLGERDKGGDGLVRMTLQPRESGGDPCRKTASAARP